MLMFAVLGSIVVGAAILAVIDPTEEWIYDCELEKMVFKPSRQDILLELLLRS